MRSISRWLLVAFGCAVVAGCAGTDYRYGKGNDHEVAYRIGDRRNENRPVYVNSEPRVVYVQPVQAVPVQPAYVYYPTTPQYQVVPVVRPVVRPTRYVYVN